MFSSEIDVKLCVVGPFPSSLDRRRTLSAPRTYVWEFDYGQGVSYEVLKLDEWCFEFLVACSDVRASFAKCTARARATSSAHEFSVMGRVRLILTHVLCI